MANNSVPSIKIAFQGGVAMFKAPDGKTLDVFVKTDIMRVKLLVKSNSAFTFGYNGNMMYADRAPIMSYHDGKISLSDKPEHTGIQFPCSLEDNGKLVDFCIKHLG